MNQPWAEAARCVTMRSPEPAFGYPAVRRRRAVLRIENYQQFDRGVVSKLGDLFEGRDFAGNDIL